MNVIRPPRLTLAALAALGVMLLAPAQTHAAVGDVAKRDKLDRDDDGDDRSSDRRQCRRPGSHRGWKSERPIADAGSDQSALLGQTVTLDGSRSRDPDGDQLKYHWELLKKPKLSRARLDGRRGVTPTLDIDRNGQYVIVLVVQSCDGVSRPDLVVVSSGGNLPPVANAGPDQRATAGDTVQLDGSGSNDPNGDALTFTWQVMTSPPGSQVTLSDPAVMRPAFTANVQGDYVLQLTVRDGPLASAPDTVTIQAEPGNSPPVANAGADQSSRIGLTAALDGSASTDPDGDALTYEWAFVSQPDGSSTQLLNESTSTPSFAVDVEGQYVIELRVCDSQGACAAPDPVLVQAAGNTAPVAVPGESRTVNVGTRVVLDGSASTDADSDPLSFSWSLTRPAGSGAQLDNPFDIMPSFVGDLPGDYLVQLIVNDGRAGSAPATLVVTVRNSPPVANDDAATTAEDMGITIDVLGNDSDANGDTLSISAVTQPLSGVVTIQNGMLRFLPAPNFNGAASFAYSVTDGRGGNASASVAVTVHAVNDAPNAMPDAVSTAINTSVSISVLGNDSDPDNDLVQIEGFTQPTSGSVTLMGTEFLFTPESGFAGDATFSYTISDGAATSTADVTVTVRLPEFSIADVSIAEIDGTGRIITFSIRLSDPSPGGISVRYQTADGTAVAPADYVARSGEMTFSAGQTSRPLTVSIVGDNLFEGNEWFVVNLSTPVGATIADSQAVGTIVDDD